MAGKISRWTPQRIREVHAAVIEGKEKRHTIREIAEEISNRWGEELSKTTLDAFLQHHPLRSAAPDVPERDTIPGEQVPAEPVSVESLEEEARDASELNQLRAAKKMLLEELRSRDTQIQNLLELRKSRPLPPVVAPNKVGGHQRNGVPVMVLSDLHVEERVDPEKVNHINKYDLDIADACLTSAFDSFMWLHDDPRWDIRTVVVAIIGDTFSGHIHEELIEGNFLSPIKATVWLQERIVRELRRIPGACPNVERIIVVMKDGNHGRNTHKIRCATRTDNSLEWLMFHTIAARMSDDQRFDFHVEEGVFTYLDIYNTSLCFLHGDIFRSMGGVGGITIPLRKGFNERKKYPQRMHHMIMGHFHQRLDIGEIIVNGSMIGPTAYSLANNFAPEGRQQTWFMVDSERGKATSNPIWLPQYKP